LDSWARLWLILSQFFLRLLSWRHTLLQKIEISSRIYNIFLRIIVHRYIYLCIRWLLRRHSLNLLLLGLIHFEIFPSLLGTRLLICHHIIVLHGRLLLGLLPLNDAPSLTCASLHLWIILLLIIALKTLLIPRGHAHLLLIIALHLHRILNLLVLLSSIDKLLLLLTGDLLVLLILI